MGEFEHYTGNIIGYVRVNTYNKPKVAAQTALVFSARCTATVGRGLDSDIYALAGYGELLAERKKYGKLKLSEAIATNSFNLGISSLIHVVVPKYMGGYLGEEQILETCYENAILKAKERGCKNVYFPLLGTGMLGFPKDIATRIANRTIESFLKKDKSMNIYLCGYHDIPEAYRNREYTIIEKSYDTNIEEEKELFGKYLDDVPIEPEELDFYEMLKEAVELKKSRENKIDINDLIKKGNYEAALKEMDIYRFGMDHDHRNFINEHQRVIIAMKYFMGQLGYESETDFKRFLVGNSLSTDRTVRSLFDPDTPNGKTRPKLLAYAIAMKLSVQEFNILLKARDADDVFPKDSRDRIIIEKINKAISNDDEPGELIRSIDKELISCMYKPLVSAGKSLEA